MDILKKLLERAQNSIIVRMHVARESRGNAINIIVFTGERDRFIVCSADFQTEGHKWSCGGRSCHYFSTGVINVISEMQKSRALLEKLCQTYMCPLSEDIQFIATHEGAGTDTPTSPQLLVCLSYLVGYMQAEVWAKEHPTTFEDKIDCYLEKLLYKRLIGFIGEQMESQRVSGIAFLRS